MATKKPTLGTITWTDLTVDDAGRVRDFYATVVGWKPEAVDMGGYSDWAMKTPATKRAKDGVMVAGICSRRELVAGPRELAGGRVAVIRDPAGAVCALFQP